MASTNSLQFRARGTRHVVYLLGPLIINSQLFIISQYRPPGDMSPQIKLKPWAETDRVPRMFVLIRDSMIYSTQVSEEDEGMNAAGRKEHRTS